MGRRHAAVTTAAMTLWPVWAARGQAPPRLETPPPVGAVQGVVVDSLVGRGPLAGAEVWVEGLARETRTDAAGRFVLDGVPAGRHRVSFSHPALQRLRLGAPVRAVEVAPGATAGVTLATPSPATVYAALCPGPRDVATGVLLGAVADDDSTGAPVARAELAAAWAVYTTGDRGVVRAERTARATSDSTGVFRLCGVPVDVPVQLRVEARGALVADEVDLAGQAVAVRLLRVAAPGGPVFGAAPDAGEEAATAALAGVVRRADGSPAFGARVRVAGVAGAEAEADEAGRYALRRLPPGAHVVEARLLGVRPIAVPVTLAAGRSARVDVTLAERVNVLAGTTVRARRTPLLLEGFEARRRRAAGHFVTADQLRTRAVFTLADALVGIPGVQVLPGSSPGPPTTIRMTRNTGQIGVMSGGCPPAVFVDGVRLPADEQVAISAAELHGVEVYTNLYGAPPQYQPLNSGCGVILAWTKRAVR